MTAVSLGVSWLVGIWVASWLHLEVTFWLVWGGLGLLGAVLLRRAAQPLALALACLGVGALGAARGQVTAVLPADHIASYNGQEDVSLTGLVVDEPDIKEQSVLLRVRAESLTLADGMTVPVTGDVLVSTGRYPVITYGTRVLVNGRLQTPPILPDFNYKEYLARQNIHSQMSYAHVTILAEGQGTPWRQAILTLKARATTVINQSIPDPQAALLRGILLGDDSGLPRALEDDFRTTGMTHIIAISGFNIAIIIGLLGNIGQSVLGKRGAPLIAIVGVVFYTVLVGADASVVRAAIMGTLYLVSQRWLGRPNFALAALLLAAFLMTLYNPHILADVGFQLSFAATLGLLLYADPFSRWTQARLEKWVTRRLVKVVMGGINEVVLVTLAAQVLTLPLMMVYFRQVSLISLPANFFILPAQPGVMLWGGLATVVGMAVPALGQMFSWVAWLFLSYTIALVRLFAVVPGAAVPIQIGLPGILAIYGGITAVTWFSRQSPAQRAQLGKLLRQQLTPRLALAGTLMALLLTLWWAETRPDGQLHVVFFNVGQGDATFIQTPSGRQILVDGGLYPTVLQERLGRQMPFGDRQVDILVATHPDADHITGLVDVFARYRVGQLLTNGAAVDHSELYRALLQAAAAAKTPLHRALVGEVIQVGDGVRLEVLHPGPTLAEEDNENSVVLRLVYGDFSLLLTGDAEEGTERALQQNGRSLAATVYKAGHHGSRTSNTALFLRAVQPQIMVISAGQENRYGHPHEEVLQRAERLGTAVLRTDELGSIELITDGHTLWLQAWPHDEAP